MEKQVEGASPRPESLPNEKKIISPTSCNG